jgi:hypothetical protein
MQVVKRVMNHLTLTLHLVIILEGVIVSLFLKTPDLDIRVLGGYRLARNFENLILEEYL